MRRDDPATWVVVSVSWAIVILCLLMILRQAGANAWEQVGTLAFLAPIFIFVD